MTENKPIKRSRKRGSALLASFGVMTLLSIAAASYINSATYSVRHAARETQDVQTTHMCEAGVQRLLSDLWHPFKAEQKFDSLEDALDGASLDDPKATQILTIPNLGKVSVGVIDYSTPTGDPYTRAVKIRAVAWFDKDDDNVLDENESRKTVDVSANFELARSQVFDYTYFVNNYGWMDGFGANDLIVNGDMRANANFSFLNGSPTINGSVIASMNEKLETAAQGTVNMPPVKWSTSTYKTQNAGNQFARQGYNPAIHGEPGTPEYENWRDFVYDSSASIVNGRVAGTAIMDSTGSKGWSRESTNASVVTNLLDTAGTKEVVMPDLSDVNVYKQASNEYRNTKATFADGSANPDYNKGAYVQVWDSTLSGGRGDYKTISTNGVVTGSAILVGTNDKPIKINGPVTFTQDCAIKGTIQGQGSIYTGRNVHIVGSIQYKNSPDFRGSNPTTVEKSVEKADMLGLAARGSVIMGNPKTFGNPYPLAYMTPPFTKGRYDDQGNFIPAFDAMSRDSTGFRRYQSVLGDDALDAVSSGINRIDAIMYTNFVGGGNLGTAGGGVTINGSIISRDEAMVIWSLPIKMNYDSRIRERQISKAPLIDLKLPRSPVLMRASWQDNGFQFRAGASPETFVPSGDLAGDNLRLAKGGLVNVGRTRTGPAALEAPAEAAAN